MGAYYTSDEDDGEWDNEEVEEKKPAASAYFRFQDLPFELRLRVYEYLLIVPKTIDLEITNIRAIAPLLRVFFVNHRMHEEAYRVFYGCNAFRVFPTSGRFFHTKKALLTRLPPRYRNVITNLELRLGPGWTKPPRCWVVDERLGLTDMGKLRLLKIYVEIDPSSHPSFEGYGRGDSKVYGRGEVWYTEFSVGVVRSLLARVPSVAEVEFDGFPSVSKASPLMQALLDEVKSHNKRITWGPERGWGKIVDVGSMAAVMTMMQKLGLDRSHEMVH